MPELSCRWTPHIRPLSLCLEEGELFAVYEFHIEDGGRREVHDDMMPDTGGEVLSHPFRFAGKHLDAKGEGILFGKGGILVSHDGDDGTGALCALSSFAAVLQICQREGENGGIRTAF